MTTTRYLLVAGALFLAWAPSASASKIFFICDGNLCRSDDRGRHVVRLTNDGVPGGSDSSSGDRSYAALSASRDGRRLAFAYGDRLFVADARGRGRRQIPLRAGAAFYSPRLRPDGREILWMERGPYFFIIRHCRAPVTGRGGRCVYGRGALGWGRGSQQIGRTDVARVLCTLRPDQGCRLAVAQATDELFVSQPDLSPNGRFLTAATEIDDFEYRLAIYDTRTARRVRTVAAVGTYAAWSPDGRSIAHTQPGAGGAPPVIYRSRAGGGKPVKVVEGTLGSWTR